MLFYYPRVPGDGVCLKNGYEFSNDMRNRELVLPDQPHDDDAGGGHWRIGLNIGRVEFQRHEHTPLPLANLDQGRIFLSAQRLVKNAECIVSGLVQQMSNFHGKVLIDLESHAAVGPERPTIRSRANSAA